MYAQKIARPFLRWAGGKTWLVNFVLSLTKGLEINNYHEPFLGGGAIFFALQPNRSFLSDMNEELIRTYVAVREHPDKVVSTLRTFSNDSECYYQVRSTILEDDFYMAARFIFLNQTSFNGLYRVNKQGSYNVPYGNRIIDFIREDRLMALSELLHKANLQYGDFSICENNICKNDLVFIDPPYTVSHNKNGFIKYNQNLFSLEDQYRLSLFIDQIKSKDAFYILTNAAHKTIQEIFDKNDVVYTLNRHSTIGGNQAKRGHVDEYIFTNICNEV